jgi:RNA polymerase sigma-70 factor, ECF subfamily
VNASDNQSDVDGESSGSNYEKGALFVQLLGRHERDLFGYIFSLTANWDDSQEVMQRLRIRLWEQFAQYDPARPFDSWARAIAYYLVLSFRKEKSREKLYFTDRVLQTLDRAYAARTSGLSESREALAACLGKLSEQKQCMITSYYSPGGPSTLERTLGLNANALRQSIHRIRRSLQQCVQKRLKTQGI